MATYVIGDVQGCFLSFIALLQEINFDKNHDKAILLGDVLNRGPRSLETLRYIYNNQPSIRMILGNHDIYAIALYYQCFNNGKPHTLNELLTASDSEELFAFLRHQPLIMKEQGSILVHAGIFPGFSLKLSLSLAHKIGKIFKGLNFKSFLTDSFVKKEFLYNKSMDEAALLRLSLWANTRMRMCVSMEEMDATYDGELKSAPLKLMPWFKFSPIKEKVYFGHWAALGLFYYKNFTCLDSGCAWGQKLTALRLEDQQIFQIDNKDKL